MEQLLEAKIEKNFMQAVKLFQGGDTFLVFNIKLKNKAYQRLEKIDISVFNESLFQDHFNVPRLDVSTDNFKYFNVNTNNLSNDLVNYHSEYFGKSSYFGFNLNNDKKIKVISIDKKNIHHIQGNNYKAIIPISESNDIKNLATNNDIKFRIFIKNSVNSILWDSDIRVNETSIAELYDNVILDENNDIVSLLCNDLISSSYILYNSQETQGVKRKTLTVDFSNNEIIESLLKPAGYTLNFNLSYNDIDLIKTNSLVENNLNFSLLGNATLIYELFNEFYQLNEKFTFNLDMSILNEPSDVNMSISSKDITLHRDGNDNIIKNIINEFETNFVNIIKYRTKFKIKYKNSTGFKTEHTIDIANNREDLEKITLNNIFYGNSNKELFSIYFNSSESDAYTLSEFNSLKELNELRNQDVSGNVISFNTLNSTNVTFNESLFKYRFLYTINDKSFEFSLDGKENLSLSGIIDINSDFKSVNQLILAVNKKLIENITVNSSEKLTANINLSETDSMIHKIESITIGNVSSFEENALELGYANSNEMFNNSIVFINLSSSFNLTSQDKEYQSFNAFNFSDIFELKSDELDRSSFNSSLNFNIISNLDYKILQERNIEGLSFLSKDFDYKDKEELLNILRLSEPDFGYYNKIEILLVPLHSLLVKYKNSGLNELLNVNNIFDNIEESNLVNKVFYDMFFGGDTRLNYNKVINAKISYFNNIRNRIEFKSLLRENLFENIDKYTKDFNISIMDFQDIIEQNKNTLNRFYKLTDSEYAYKFNKRMFNKNIKPNVFFDENRIYSNFNDIKGIKNESIPVLLSYRNQINLRANFLNEVYESINDLEIDINKTQFDVRLNLIPYFAQHTQEENYFAGNDYFDVVVRQGVKCITLKNIVYTVNNIGFEKSIYQGIKNVSGNISDKSYVKINMDTENIDLFKTDIYRAYLNSGIINNIGQLGYSSLFDIQLNVCIIASIEDANNKYYFSDYYGISLFNNKNYEDAIPINNITTIVFNKI